MTELLSPAGNMEKMKAALRFGADAVYLAGVKYGMRAAADNFTVDELREAVAYASQRGKKVYLTLNVMPHGDEYADLEAYMEQISDIGLSGLICADLGVIALASKRLPHIPIHVSTQASVVSARAAEVYARLGARRIVLARELSLAEIVRLRRELTKEVELEAFVHGSMCVSYSGRCLFSNFFTGRDGNRGMCAQPCRWNYHQFEIAEEKRPGSHLTVEVTDRGTFFLSSRDMCMIGHVSELIEAGIDSFKIEGRMKSAYYTAVTANAYRMALDAYARDPEHYAFDPTWLRELESVSHREYCTGFYYDSPLSEPQLVSSPGYLRDKAYLAHAVSYDGETGRAQFIQHNKFFAGDTVELLTPGLPGRSFRAEELRGEEGEEIPSTPHPLMRFSMRVPFPVKEGDILRGGDDGGTV